MSSERQLILGFFFVVVFSILIGFTLFLTDFQLFGERFERTVYFSQTNGLRVGDPVLVAGMRWGKVEDLDFDPQAEVKKRIRVKFTLKDRVDLREDHQVLIKDATLLGGKHLWIDPGTASSPLLAPGTELLGTVSPNVMEAVEQLVEENREALRRALAGLDIIIQDVQSSTGMLGKILYDDEVSANFSSAMANVASAFENIDVLSRDLRRGKGTFGMLLTDEGKAYEDLSNLLRTGREIVENAAAGKGAIGMLLADEQVAEDIGVFVDNLARISTSIEGTTRAIDEGDGVIGMLVNDSELRDDVRSVFSKLANGEGTLGKLISDSQIYDDFAATAKNLRELSDAGNNGDGTIAQLFHDDALYQDLRTMLAKLTGSLEEAREAAPISTFLNTVFLGF